MNRAEPRFLEVGQTDKVFLGVVAERILGPATVAATNAIRLREYGFDAARIDRLIPSGSMAVRCQEFVFKKVSADPESPQDFGLFVRRAEADPQPVTTV